MAEGVMQVDAMLCDYAQVHQGKLFISGASIDLIGTPSPQPPHPASFYLAALITVPWNATNQLHRVAITIRDLDRNSMHLADAPSQMKVREEEQGAIIAEFNVGRSPMMQNGESSHVPLAVPFQIPMPHLGPFIVGVAVDGTILAEHNLRLIAPTPHAFGGAADLPNFGSMG